MLSGFAHSTLVRVLRDEQRAAIEFLQYKAVEEREVRILSVPLALPVLRFLVFELT